MGPPRLVPQAVLRRIWLCRAACVVVTDTHGFYAPGVRRGGISTRPAQHGRPANRRLVRETVFNCLQVLPTSLRVLMTQSLCDPFSRTFRVVSLCEPWKHPRAVRETAAAVRRQSQPRMACNPALGNTPWGVAPAPFPGEEFLLHRDAVDFQADGLRCVVFLLLAHTHRPAPHETHADAAASAFRTR